MAAADAPAGRLAVVDDMPEPAAAASEDLGTLKAGWQCPVLWSSSDYQAAFARAGRSLVTQLDLTAFCLHRAGPHQAADEAQPAGVPPCACRTEAGDGLAHGGLALERLTRAGLVR